ncbi:MAG: ABC transporter ATP-binding protein [Clostridia bacterium]|nr:ABC transporter ATP-binding protein [Clostridia bacterium]
MKLMLRYLRPYLKSVIWVLIIKFLATLSELFLPYILSYILDDVVPLERASLIFLWGGVMILCALAAFGLNVWANRGAAAVSRDATRDIRHDLFEKILGLSSHQTDAFTVPSLESRITSDTFHVSRFLGIMQRMGVRAPILLFGGIILTATLDWKLMLVMLAVLPLIFCAVFYISRKGIPLYGDVQKQVDGMTRVVREDSKGIRVIKALSRVDYERNRFDEVNESLVRAEKKAGITMAASNPSMNLFLNLGMTAVIFVGALLIARDNGTEVGVVTAFTQYFTLIANALMAVTRIFVMYTKASASAQRIEEVLQCESDMPLFDKRDYPDLPYDEQNYLVFDHVNFSYNKTKNNLTDLSFSIPKGGTLGIIGATGSGKSTVLQLLMRFYDVDSGSVRIGGRDVRTVPLGELRSLFGAALQNDILFSGSVEENLTFGRAVEADRLRSAVETAQAAEFVDQLADGLNYQLTVKGTNLSGGQRQRLLIARALAADPDILILDDSSSALDYKTDANLRSALAKRDSDATCIVVAQRVSSVMNSDKILVLEEGEAIAFGTHEELMKSCDAYREISHSQMGGAILE